MANKKLSQFNQITTLTNGTHQFPMFRDAVDNYWAEIEDAGKALSIWQSITDTAIAYSGGGQTNATQITKKITIFTTVAANNDSAKLPDAEVGVMCVVTNEGNYNMQLYPKATENFSGLSDNVAINVPTKTTVMVYCGTATTWYYKSFDLKPSTTSITAYAGGGQANATAIKTEYAKVTTVATAADSVKIRKAVAGCRHVVVNDGANACNIYPQTGDNFEGAAANAAQSLPAGNTLEVFCFVDGEYTILG